jgi:hypothetical protein
MTAAQEPAMLKATNEKESETMNTSAITITMEAHHQQPTQGLAAQVGCFLLHFLELQIPMGLGALVCYLLGRLIPASSSFATVYHPGTYLFATGDVLFLTVPVVAWMIFRGHGWRRSMEMAFAMIAPVAAIVVLGEFAGVAYLLWLVTAMYPTMCLGMLVYMLYRREALKAQPLYWKEASRSTSAHREM